MFTITDYVMLGMATLFTIIWIIFFLKGLKDAKLFDSLSEKEYPLKEIFFVGYAFMNFIHYGYRSKKDRSLRKELGVLYGEQYIEYYLRVVYAQRTTYAMTLLVLGFILYGFAADVLVSLVVIVFAGAAYYYFGTEPGNKISKRSAEILNDFSNVVSQLALLTNAGMIMKEAWEQVAYNGETIIYLEMQKSVDEMNNGLSETDALYRFGQRCVIPEIKKFTSTIIQGIEKGNSELTMMLQNQSGEVWEEKKQNVKQQGEKAASKLLFPMILMFMGILIMVIVPIFANIGV